MGLFFRSRRRRRGPGLVGLVMMLGLCLLLVPVVLGRSGNIFTSCQNLTRSLGNTGHSVCIGLQQMMVSLNDLGGLARGTFGNVRVSGGDWTGGGDGIQASLRERWQALNQRLDSGSGWQGGEGASSLVSMERVREMIRSGGSYGSMGGGGASGQLQNAFGSFMAGQSLGQSGESLESQLAWYKNGAGMGEYGILSQLKLGSLYMGNDGVNADFGQAYDYNMQALGSLQALQSSSSPEAGAALNALPMEPAKLQVQLQEVLRQLQLKQ